MKLTIRSRRPRSRFIDAAAAYGRSEREPRGGGEARPTVGRRCERDHGCRRSSPCWRRAAVEIGALIKLIGGGGAAAGGGGAVATTARLRPCCPPRRRTSPPARAVGCWQAAARRWESTTSSPTTGSATPRCSTSRRDPRRRRPRSRHRYLPAGAHENDRARERPRRSHDHDDHRQRQPDGHAASAPGPEDLHRPRTLNAGDAKTSPRRIRHRPGHRRPGCRPRSISAGSRAAEPGRLAATHRAPCATRSASPACSQNARVSGDRAAIQNAPCTRPS
jgi:hypothetical protein